MKNKGKKEKFEKFSSFFSHLVPQRGVTLIELLLIVGIVSIIGLSSVAFYSRFFTQSAVANTADKVTSQLRKAQMYAMSGKQNGNWGVHNGANEIVLFQGATYAGRNTAFDEIFNINNNITISGFTDIIFTKTTGIPNTTATITITGAGNEKNIAINAQGSVSSSTVASGGGPWFNTSYLYKKKITIDHTKISGGADLNNFPVLISVTDADLKTVANGGFVNNSNGYDIIFTDNTEAAQLDHEIEKYNQTTGEVQFWVRIPTLSASVDTDIYLYFGNNSISTSQEDKVAVWDSNYKGIWHLSENPAGTAPQMKDSTSNANNGTSNGSMTLSDQVTGKIDGSLDFDGSNDYIGAPDSSSLRLITNGTFAAWVRSTNITSAHFILEKGNNDNDNYSLFALDGVLRFEFSDSGGTYRGDTCVDTTTLTMGTWYYVVVTYDDTNNQCKFYVNGNLSSTDSTTYTLNTSTTNSFHIGAELFTTPTAVWTGGIDEVRISNAVRSAGWIATEYNNQNSPSTFYSIGAKTGQ